MGEEGTRKVGEEGSNHSQVRAPAGAAREEGGEEPGWPSGVCSSLLAEF